MLLEKIILGVTLAAPIGPVSLEMIRRGLNHGFLSAFIVRVGGAFGNTLCLIMATFGLSLLTQSPVIMNICALLGAIVLIYLGIKSLLKTKSIDVNFSEKSATHSYLSGLMTGFVVSIANPIGIMFWISIFAASYQPDAYTSHAMSLFQNSAIIVGVLLWGVLLSGLLEVGKRFFSNRFIKLITFGAGLMLVYFGLKYGIRAGSALYAIM
ncbi:MAG: LysE family translocator [Candidatus Berkiella sp.]